jgi:hypothetical protein
LPKLIFNIWLSLQPAGFGKKGSFRKIDHKAIFSVTAV